MERFLGELRPSALASARVPTFAVATDAQAHALGQPAVAIPVRTAPISLLEGASASAKINNYMTNSYKGTTSATTITSDRVASADTRIQQVQIVKARGGDARGNPPRGRPV